MAGPRQTVIIAVGDEVLSGHTQDTNSRLLARHAFAAGFPVRRIEVVADELDDIAVSVRRAVGDPTAARIAVCGGIGPTPDDRTFEAVAIALDRPRQEHPEAIAHITALVERMHQAGWIAEPTVSEGNRRCALVPVGGTVLVNRRGMAPPMAYAVGPDRWLFVLPGVPREFSAIVTEELMPRYFTGGAAAVVAEVVFPRVPEAELFGPLQRIGAEFSDVSAGSYPQIEAVQVIVRIQGQDAARVAATVTRLLELEPRGVIVDRLTQKEESAGSPRRAPALSAQPVADNSIS